MREGNFLQNKDDIKKALDQMFTEWNVQREEFNKNRTSRLKKSILKWKNIVIVKEELDNAERPEVRFKKVLSYYSFERKSDTKIACRLVSGVGNPSTQTISRTFKKITIAKKTAKGRSSTGASEQRKTIMTSSQNKQRIQREAILKMQTSSDTDLDENIKDTGDAMQEDVVEEERVESEAEGRSNPDIVLQSHNKKRKRKSTISSAKRQKSQTTISSELFRQHLHVMRVIYSELQIPLLEINGS